MKIHLASGDLQARARLGAAAERIGAEWEAGAAVGFGETLPQDVDLLVLDLDAGGIDAITEAEHMPEAPPRVIGFYSHINDELGRAADAAGVTAIRRGRFWRNIESVLRG